MRRCRIVECHKKSYVSLMLATDATDTRGATTRVKAIRCSSLLPVHSLLDGCKLYRTSVYLMYFHTFAYNDLAEITIST